MLIKGYLNTLYFVLNNYNRQKHGDKISTSTVNVKRHQAEKTPAEEFCLLCHDLNRVPCESRIQSATSAPAENTDPQSSGVSLQRKQTHWGIYYKQKEELSIAMKAQSLRIETLFSAELFLALTSHFSFFRSTSELSTMLISCSNELINSWYNS